MAFHVAKRERDAFELSFAHHISVDLYESDVDRVAVAVEIRRAIHFAINVNVAVEIGGALRVAVDDGDGFPEPLGQPDIDCVVYNYC